MATPPNDIENFDLFQRLAKAERPHEIVDFPRNDSQTGEPIGKLAIVVLKECEILSAQAAAARFAHDNLQLKYGENEPDAGYRDVLNNALATEVLQRACKKAVPNPENEAEWIAQINLPLFPKTGQLRELLTHDEIAVLYNQYSQVQRKLGPITSELSKDDCNAWLELLEKGGSRSGLAFFSSVALTDLALHMVAVISSLRMELSSAGSLQDGTAPESNPTTVD